MTEQRRLAAIVSADKVIEQAVPSCPVWVKPGNTLIEYTISA